MKFLCKPATIEVVEVDAKESTTFERPGNHDSVACAVKGCCICEVKAELDDWKSKTVEVGDARQLSSCLVD